MTVQELIDELNKIENKQLLVKDWVNDVITSVDEICIDKTLKIIDYIQLN